MNGWLYLAVVVDLFSRQMVGGPLREDMTCNIVIGALRMAWFMRHPGKYAELLFHSVSDRDSPLGFKEYGTTSLMSRRGNCRDNTCSETLFGSLKVGRLHMQRFVARRHTRDNPPFYS